MTYGQPLRPDENEYRTAVDTERDPPEPGTGGSPASPATEPRPWIWIAIVALLVFLALLGSWLILPLLG